MKEEYCINCGDVVNNYKPEICCKKWTINTDCDCRGLPLNPPVCKECEDK
jgi:hypothetical protein